MLGALAAVEGAPIEDKLAFERAKLTAAEDTTNQRRADLNALSFHAEEVQQRLEVMSEQHRLLSMIPTSPVVEDATPFGKRAASPLSLADASETSSITSHDTNQPTVALEQARAAVETRVARLEPDLHEAEDHGETLHMMLVRTREAHARIQSDIATLRDEGLGLNEATRELKLLVGQAQGAAVVAQQARRETALARSKNAALYASKLKERRLDAAITRKQHGIVLKQGSLIVSRPKRLGGGGGGDDVGDDDGDDDGDEQDAGWQARTVDARAAVSVGDLMGGKGVQALQQGIIAKQMTSLVLMQHRDENVEQVSRYEAAFRKMARAAGSNDPDVVISRFMARNETRAGLLDTRDVLRRKKSNVEADIERLSARLRELQYSAVHPAQSEAAMRRLEPKLTKASSRLELAQNQLGKTRALHMHVSSGCMALLMRIASAAPAIGTAPDEHEESGRGGAAATSNGGAGAGGSGVGTSFLTEVPAAADVEGTDGPEGGGTAAAEGALEEKTLRLFNTCGTTLERLLAAVDGDETAGLARSTSGREQRASHVSFVGTPGLTPTPPAKPRAPAGAAATARSPRQATAGASTAALRASQLEGGALQRGHPPLVGLGAAERAARMGERAATLNIRVGPAVELPPHLLSEPSDLAQPPAALATRRSSISAPASAEQDKEPEDEVDEAERDGYFGEERRRIKVGERPASARAAAGRRSSSAAGGPGAKAPFSARPSTAKTRAGGGNKRSTGPADSGSTPPLSAR